MSIYTALPRLPLFSHSPFHISSAIKNARSFSMSVTRFVGSILTILLIVSLIPESTAQSSSRVASAASQTSSWPVEHRGLMQPR
ncbi:hypothetical protein IG631_23265 [Alternaria alternata]|nr:hypothetical protein IG631_23265 [Alternaria alternata]